MSDIHGSTSTSGDGTRELGTVDVSPATGPDSYGTDSHGTDTPVGGATTSYGGTDTPVGGATTSYGGTDTPVGGATTSNSDTTQVAKDEARATGHEAKEGAKHIAEVGKDEAKNVVQETGQQAKELWQQTRSQLLDQSAQQQTRVADGLRSLSQELSAMARNSEQQGVASDLAQQASQRMGHVAGWLDQRDPGSLVTEVKQFARQRPGAFLAAAAVIGLVGGRLSRGLVADHQDQATEDESAHAAAYGGTHTGTTGTSTGTTGTTGNGYTAAHSHNSQSATADPDAFPA